MVTGLSNTPNLNQIFAKMGVIPRNATMHFKADEPRQRAILQERFERENGNLIIGEAAFIAQLTWMSANERYRLRDTDCIRDLREMEQKEKSFSHRLFLIRQL